MSRAYRSAPGLSASPRIRMRGFMTCIKHLCSGFSSAYLEDVAESFNHFRQSFYHSRSRASIISLREKRSRGLGPRTLDFSSKGDSAWRGHDTCQATSSRPQRRRDENRPSTFEAVSCLARATGSRLPRVRCVAGERGGVAVKVGRLNRLSARIDMFDHILKGSKKMSESQAQTPAQKLIGDFAPKLAALTDEVLFGDVWERTELSKRDRSLITVAALIAGGNTEQLLGHLKRAKDNGLTENGPESPRSSAGG